MLVRAHIIYHIIMWGGFMVCGLEDMRSKEVIDIKTGERLGYIDDAEINIDSSEVIALVIYGRSGLFGIFGKEEDIVIPCADIRVVGSDVVLIERSEESKSSHITNNRRLKIQSLFK